MQTLRHCLQAVDFDDLGEVTASQLVRLLKSKWNKDNSSRGTSRFVRSVSHRSFL
jgi:hypothetical protein